MTLAALVAFATLHRLALLVVVSIVVLARLYRSIPDGLPVDLSRKPADLRAYREMKDRVRNRTPDRPKPAA